MNAAFISTVTMILIVSLNDCCPTMQMYSSKIHHIFCTILFL